MKKNLLSAQRERLCLSAILPFIQGVSPVKRTIAGKGNDKRITFTGKENVKGISNESKLKTVNESSTNQLQPEAKKGGLKRYFSNEKE